MRDERQDSAAATSQYWLTAKPRKKSGPVRTILLAVSAPPANPQVMRYLIAKVAGQELPFGIDYHDTLEDVFAICEQDFGIQPDNWKRLESPPDFVAPVQDAIDETIDRLTNDGNSS